MTKDYYEVFQKRSSRYGRTFKEYATNNAKRNFARLLKSSPNAISVRLNDTELSIPALTLSDTDKDVKDIREFCFDKEVKAKVGDFIYWENDIWFIFNKVIDTVDAYDKFDAIYCQQVIKWVDEYGLLHSTPAYVGGIANSVVKLVYNRSNSSVVLDPAENNTLKVITARKDIKLGQRFIIGDRAWKLIESDYITIPGVCYLVLGEDKLLTNDDNTNNQDDIDQDIADIVDLNKFNFNDLPTDITIEEGKTFVIDPVVYLNGVQYTKDVTVEVVDSVVISYDNGTITGLQTGTTSLVIKMNENTEVQHIINVTVDASAADIIEDVIVGNDSVKVGGRTAEYQFKRLINGESVPAVLEYFVCEGELATISLLGNTAILTTNNQNKLGTVILKAKFTDGIEINKEVRIKSLWG